MESNLIEGVMSVMAYVDDYSAGKAFYGDVLGLEYTGDMGEDACFFRIGDNRHGLFLEGGYKQTDGHEQHARASFTLKTASATQLFERLVNARATMIHDSPNDMGNGTFWFQFRDPAGNIIEAIGPA